MGENDASLEESPPKRTKETENKVIDLGSSRSLLKKDECSDTSSKVNPPALKKRRVEQDTEFGAAVQNLVDASDVSPIIKSRYGRTHKPNIPEDFLPTDKKVGAILGHSPQKSPGKVSGSTSTSPAELAKVCQKGRKLHDTFVKKEGRSKVNKESENLIKIADTVSIKSEKPDFENKDVTVKSGVGFVCSETPENVKQEEKQMTDITKISKASPQKTKLLMDSKISECNWVVGDLGWARVYGYPFWPCMIALDPDQGIFTKTSIRGTSTHQSLHVQFFGDNGRRSWLFSSCVIPFEGHEGLKKLSATLQSEVKKRDPKFVAAFNVTPKAKVKWDIAVSDAEAAMKQTRSERLQDFTNRYPINTPSKRKTEPSSSSPKKRSTKQQRHRSEDRNSTPKTAKRSHQTFRSPSPELGDENLNDENWTPLKVTPGSKSKTTTTEVKTLKQQRKKYNTSQTYSTDFEAFLYKHIDRVSQDHPDFSMKAVKKYLAVMWEEMDDLQKSKFGVGARFKKDKSVTQSTKIASIVKVEEEENEEKVKDGDIDNDDRDEDNGDADDDADERQSNESEKTDSSGTRESSPAPFFKLKKGGGLFRGTKQEKVCQICEKPGDTVKCRGPCSGIFHVECLSKSVIEKEKENLIDISPIKSAKKRASFNKLNYSVNETNGKHLNLTDTKEGGESLTPENKTEITKYTKNSTTVPIENELSASDSNFVPKKRQRLNTEGKECDTTISNENTTVVANNVFNVEEVSQFECKETENEHSSKVKYEIEKKNVNSEMNGENDSVTTKKSEEKTEENHTMDTTVSVSNGEEVDEIMDSKEKSDEANNDVKDNHDEKMKEEKTEVITVKEEKDKEKFVVDKREQRSITRKRDKEETVEKEEENEGTNVGKAQYKRTRGSRNASKEPKKEVDVISAEKQIEEEKIITKKKEKEEKKCKEDVTDENVPEYRCKDCEEGKIPPCLACGRTHDTKTGKEHRQRCAIGHCGKYYHMECLKLWPHAWSSGTSRRKSATGAAKNEDVTRSRAAVTCPQHVCHTCASDDPRNATTRFNHERLVRCIRCPTAYHTGNYCLPAGSEILTGTQIICPKHYKPPQKKTYHVNAAWCFICAMGGSLICCDLCPTSFHAECLRISPPEGSFICEDCDTGRFPLYGEIVWVKLGAYRWWPAQILYPSQIPDNIYNLPHVLGEFAVRFFGSHDYYWVNRGRVFLYQEGDTGHSTSRKSYMEGTFSRALLEASEAQQTLKVEKATREAEARPGMKPPMYVKIKSNKAVGNVRMMEMDPSSMTPCDCDPKSDNPCGPETDCLNRILLVECSPAVCLAGDKCGNQCFEKRLYPPLIPYRTETRGWGLKTLANIRKGDFVIEYVGEMIDEAEYQRRMTRKHEEKDENYYFLTIDKDRMLDAGPKGNVARFMNHSCQPNCETQKWTVNGDTRVGLFALEDIEAGTELNFNYNLECVGRDKKPCMCGAPNCSGFIGMKAAKQPAEEDKKPRPEQQNLIKRYKKRRSVSGINDDLCFICQDSGKLLHCENKTCRKGYHLHCLKLKRSPEGKWLCPWHRCNVCKKRTVRRCGYCPSSFCPHHAEGNIRVHPTLGLVCQKHDDKMVSKNVKEVSLNTSPLIDTKEVISKEEIVEESLSRSKEFATEAKDLDDESTNKDKLDTFTEETKPTLTEETKPTPISCIEGETVIKQHAVDLNEDKNDICNESNDANVRKVTEEKSIISETSLEKENGIAEAKSFVDDDKITVKQNVNDESVLNDSDAQKERRGRLRKQTVKSLEVVKHKRKTSRESPQFSKIELNNELESLALSFTDTKNVTKKQTKLSRRRSSIIENDTAVNGLLQSSVKKARGRPKKFSLDIRSEPGFEVGENNGLDIVEGDKSSSEKNAKMNMEKEPLQCKEDSSIQIQSKCNETKSSSSESVAVNGIETSGMVLLPVES